MNLFSEDHHHEGLIDLFKDTLAHNIVGLWGIIFAVVIIVNLISYKASGRQSEKKMGVLGGALLGLVPGCGGTVAVTSMYAQKKASFGAVLASFIATLGEGSFVLIGSDPKAYLIISAVGFAVALIAGYVVEFFKVETYFPGSKVKPAKAVKAAKTKESKLTVIAEKAIQTYLFYPLMILGTVFLPLSILTIISETAGEGNFFFEAHDFMHSTLGVVSGIVISLLVIIYWVGYMIAYKEKECACKGNLKQHLIHGLRDATMIMAIITLATLATTVVIDYWIGDDNLVAFLTGWGVFLVVLAALIGAIPGCAPYLILIGIVMGIEDHHHGADSHSLLHGDHDHEHHTTLWGVLIAGGIATSGDGIFGLLAVSKEKAGLVTLFSIVLGIVVGVPIHLIFN